MLRRLVTVTAMLAGLLSLPAQALEFRSVKETGVALYEALYGAPAYVRGPMTIAALVTAIEDGGIEVEYDGMKSFIRRSDLSRDRSEQRPERFTKGDKVDARITNIDKAARRVSLSIKSLEMAEEKEAIEQFGSSDSGASLGDILGAALKQREADGDVKED